MNDFVIGVGSTLIASGGFVWLFKTALIEALKKSAKKDVETLKHELDSHKERLKYDLQKDMISAELQTGKVHAVYPDLFEKLRMAEGAVSSFCGISYVANWKDFGIDDLRTMLEGRSLTRAKVTELISGIAQDRTTGIEKMDDYLNEITKYEARKKITDARNFRILKGLFLSPQVRSDCDAILKKLSDALVDLTLIQAGQYEQGKATLKQAEIDLDALEIKMRAELGPRQ